MSVNLKAYYPRLARRNHTFYFRVAIPRHLWYLSKRKEIKYSLKTCNYQDALFEMRTETIKADFYIEFLKELDMRKRTGSLILEDDDIDKFILYRVKQIDDFCEKHKLALQHKTKSFDDIGLFTQKNLQNWIDADPDSKMDEQDTTTDDLRFQMSVLSDKIKDFLKDMKKNPTTPPNILSLIDDVLGGKLNPLPRLNSPVADVAPKLPKMLKEVQSLEDYAQKQVQSVAEDVPFVVPRNYKPYVRAIELAKAEQFLQSSSTKTPWKEVYLEWMKELEKKHQTNKDTQTQYLYNLNTVFSLVDKEYVEDIGYYDVKKISSDIYRVPKNWVKKSKGKKLLNLLLPEGDKKALGKKTAQQYLICFQAFMKFAKKERYIPDSYAENIVIPAIKRAIPQKEAFTKRDLMKIFSPKTYPNEIDQNYYPRYWIPLIALYTGNRIGEIAQLYTKDVVIGRKISYFKFIPKEKDQSVKTTASWREVPIHPDLIELGFLDFVRDKQKKKEQRLFGTLKFDKNDRNGYANAVGKWFNERYLVQIGVKSPTKSFHSFRYVVKQTFRPHKLSKELLNAILGWEREDIGDSVYGGIIPASELYPDFIKLQYPFLKRYLKSLRARKHDTYYKK